MFRQRFNKARDAVNQEGGKGDWQFRDLRAKTARAIRTACIVRRSCWGMKMPEPLNVITAATRK
jgi:hypothetical protein